LVEEDEEGQLEIDSVLNEAFGQRLEETHWIDGFSIEKLQQEQEQVEYRPEKTVSPMSFLVAKTINGKTSMRLLRSLFDSGGSATMIHKRCLPKGCETTRLTNNVTSNTIAGNFTSEQSVVMKEITLPEFDRNKRIDQQGAFVFDGECNYDVILGRDFLTNAGIDIRFQDNKIQWMNLTVEMKTTTGSDETIILSGQDRLDDDGFVSSTTTILDAKYDGATPEEVAQKQTHLTQSQREDIRRLVAKYPKLFSNKLRLYPHRKIHLEIDPTAIPKHCRPYSVARAHLQVFKKELDRLVSIGVLRQCGATEWAAPTMVIPKKDNTVRVVSDFRELNKVIRRRVYPLPRIQDVLNRRTGYLFFSKLDVSMQFYTFELDEESKELCTIVTPFGKYQYNRLPMGIKCSPDIAQETMEEVLRGLDCEVYIDDIGCFSTDWKSHISLLEQILQRLEANGFMINPLKCEWGVKETDWLGYWLTPVGLKPWQKKVDGILSMQAPKNIKQLRSFIGAVNYYRDLWPRRAHILHPLTSLTGKTKFEWTDQHQQAFETIKAVVASDALMMYPDHNKPFEIYTDASDYQIGACIMQEGKPVAYFSRKLTQTQQNYTTMEKELLAIISTLAEFRTMLLGSKIFVYTDHKNLTFRNLNSSRVLRWRLFLEDFDISYAYVAGKNNVLGDAFSRLPRLDDIVVTEGKTSSVSSIEDSLFSSLTDNKNLLDCFLNLPTQRQMRYPLDLRWIQENQFEDTILNEMRQEHPGNFPAHTIDGVPLLCYRKDHLDESVNNWRICIPSGLLRDMVVFFHKVLGHAGEVRVYDSIRARFHHPKLKAMVEEVRKDCQVCRKYKLQGPGYGELSSRQVTMAPWEEVHIDLIGPWTVSIDGREVEFNALTCIDPVTNLVELARIDRKTAQHIAQKFENSWLSRYPMPMKCVHDNGGEFIGWEFQELLEKCGIKDCPTTSRNPQGNAVCERMHQTVGNVLRTLLHGEKARGETADEIIDTALATVTHTLRTAISRSLNFNSPGELAFRRHMFLNLPLEADLQALQQHRQLRVDRNLAKANSRRLSYDYRPGQLVYVKSVAPTKLGERSEGPFQVEVVHTNGTITIRRNPYVTERVNIRRVFPTR
jgi:transposase InsO family protein